MEDHGDATAAAIHAGTFQITRSVSHRPDPTVVPAENFFREAELNFTNVQLLL
jgi:hypothetical protein